MTSIGLLLLVSHVACIPFKMIVAPKYWKIQPNRIAVQILKKRIISKCRLKVNGDLNLIAKNIYLRVSRDLKAIKQVIRYPDLRAMHSGCFYLIRRSCFF